MRKARQVVVSYNARFCHSWQDGNAGHDWKSRELDERRQLALSSLVEVTKRKRIGDAVQQRLRQNYLRSKEVKDEELTEVLGVYSSPPIQNNDDDLLKEVMEVFSSESIADTLSHIPAADLEFVKGELYDTQIQEQSLRELVELRRKQESSFQSLPQEERTQWSPWYLKDIRSSKSDS